MEINAQLNTEIWKSITDYEDKYEVSNFGRIKSLSRYDPRGVPWKEKILKPIVTTKGYLTISLWKNNKNKRISVHRTVAFAFIENPNPEKFDQINHKDGIKTNNHVDNLEWTNNSGNQLHAYRNNLKKSRQRENHQCFKGEIYAYDSHGNLIETFYGGLDMSKKGYDASSVYKCVLGIRKTHKKLTFSKTLK